MHKKIIVGNWKLNKNLTEVGEWVDGMRILLKDVVYRKHLDVVICPSYPYLLGMVDLLDELGVSVGAQDASQFEEGTYTGEVSARMLAEIVDYVLIGHSERRKFFKEDLTVIKNKTNKVLSNNMTPIVCISDNVWEDGLPSTKYNEKYFLNQMEVVLKGLTKDDQEKIIFGYEPPSAISKQKGGKGYGQAADINSVVKTVELIKTIAPNNRVIYGGSVKADNVMLYLSQEVIDGVLPGSASIYAQDFGAMVLTAVEGLNGRS